MSVGWRYGIHGGALTVGARTATRVHAPARQIQMLARQGAEAKLM
jgi:hypothetical protein